MIVVTNSTPIISLAKIDKLHLLRDIFGKIYVPNAVDKEVALNIKVIGTIAILSMAKDLGLIENIKPYLDKMKVKGVWIDDQIYAISLKDVNELP